MSQEFNSSKMLQLIWKWKKQLIIVLIVAIAVSAIGSSSFFIKPKYKSVAVAYPVNLIPYGEESTTEQLLSLLRSASVRDSVISKLDLAKHYRIKVDSKIGKSYLLDEWSDNITINNTELEAAEIKVMDTDPDSACMIANEILKQGNLLARRLQRKSTNELLAMYKKQVDGIKHDIDSMEILIKDLRTQYGIVEFDAQVEEVTKGYLKVAGGSSDVSKLSNVEAVRMMRNFEEKGGDYLKLKNRINSSKEYYFRKLEEFNTVQTDAAKELTYSNVISQPIPANKKSYPVRWLIVFLSTVSSLFFALIVIGYIDRKNAINEEIAK